MPNVRRKDKKFVAAWVKKQTYYGLQKVATRQGVPASEIIASLLTQHLDGQPQIAQDKPVSSAMEPAPVVKVQAVSYRRKDRRKRKP